MKVVLSVSIELIKRSSFMLYPIIPGSINKVFKILNIDFDSISFNNILDLNNGSHKITKPEPIFPRIDIVKDD